MSYNSLHSTLALFAMRGVILVKESSANGTQLGNTFSHKFQPWCTQKKLKYLRDLRFMVSVLFFTDWSICSLQENLCTKQFICGRKALADYCHNITLCYINTASFLQHANCAQYILCLHFYWVAVQNDCFKGKTA